MAKTAITPIREQNYPEWYQQVITAAELAETSPVRGCMVIRPWGYALWENIQADLDKRFKATGHVNAYFPLLIPLSHLEKEAKHVDGFAKECAVVTHHRLETKPEGGLAPAGELEEPLVIRPTSETMVGEMYSKWIQSHRDLPVLINQWANVMRWEMRTRLFLRTAEFLWQEGHTAHATKTEAIDETKQMLNVYTDFSEELLAIPVIQGTKTLTERFPGAEETYCIEAMMQDRKALQAGTSHFLGQRFAKAANIQFQDKAGDLQHVWTTSWGMSTRIIGGLIMTHSDDDGLVLPPRVAPLHIVIIPIYRDESDKESVFEYCDALQKQLSSQHYHHQPLLVKTDKRDIRGGEKTWSWVKKGVPLRIEIGPRDIAEDSLMLSRRDQTPRDKQKILLTDVIAQATTVLDDIQAGLFSRAKAHLESHTHHITSLDEFTKFFTPKNANKPEIHGGFARCFAIDSPALENYTKPLKVSPRCIPLKQSGQTGKCLFTGKETQTEIIFAKAY